MFCCCWRGPFCCRRLDVYSIDGSDFERVLDVEISHLLWRECVQCSCTVLQSSWSVVCSKIEVHSWDYDWGMPYSVCVHYFQAGHSFLGDGLRYLWVKYCEFNADMYCCFAYALFFLKLNKINFSLGWFFHGLRPKSLCQMFYCNLLWWVISSNNSILSTVY